MDAERELTNWLIQHAPLVSMCEAGGWPDLEHMNIKTVHQDRTSLRIIIDFNEYIQDISECNPSIYNRCGEFAIQVGEGGELKEIKLITRMS